MTDNYKLYYFNSRGRCEPIRMILTISGIPFEDVRFTDEQWTAAKASGQFPGGQIPCLEINGVKYGQSLAITRLLARKTGLAGKSSLDELKIDAIADYIIDLLNPLWTREFGGKDPDTVKALWEYTINSCGPKILETLDKLAEGPFFLGSDLTWADLVFLDACETWENQKIIYLMDKFPKLVQLRKSIASHSKVASYLAKQPKTLW